MNPKKTVLRYGLLLILAGTAPLSEAQDLAGTGMKPDLNDFLILVSIVLTVIMLFLLFVLLKFVRILKEESNPVKEQRTSIWEKLLSLKPLAKEKELVIDHEYDGIYELNNPIPAWFNVLFYGTILFGVVYWYRYHIREDAVLQVAEYEAEMAGWESRIAKYKETAPDLITESTVQLVTDPEVLAKTQPVFIQNCSPCHGKLGEGVNAPNLTDEYWIHGGRLSDVFRTISEGVQAKGMISWKTVLKPAQIQEMASYVLSLKGTVPEGTGKPPEGEKVLPDTEIPGRDTSGVDTLSALSYIVD